MWLFRLLAVSLLIEVAVLAPALASDIVRLTGAGASFPAPLYQRWFRDYHLKHPKVQVDYQPIGSGGGLNNFIDGNLDFAGTDLRMTADQAARVEGGILQFPLTAGAVVVVYNLPGIDALRLSRKAVADIFLGKVESWNDPVIRSTNEGVELPDMPVTVIARSESSGTTHIMTRHLSAISEEFAAKVGTTMTPVWPESLKKRGALVRGKGNGGVAAHVKAIPGAIGYVQYSYGHLTNMHMACLQNQAGNFVPPNSESFKTAVDSFRAELDLTNMLDPLGAGSYPILTLSWLVLRRSYAEEKAEALANVLRYCLTEGQKAADLLGYIPLTEQSIRLLLQQVDEIE